jgi:hypothetical protein
LAAKTAAEKVKTDAAEKKASEERYWQKQEALDTQKKNTETKKKNDDLIKKYNGELKTIKDAKAYEAKKKEIKTLTEANEKIVAADKTAASLLKEVAEKDAAFKKKGEDETAAAAKAADAKKIAGLTAIEGQLTDVKAGIAAIKKKSDDYNPAKVADRPADWTDAKAKLYKKAYLEEKNTQAALTKQVADVKALKKVADEAPGKASAKLGTDLAAAKKAREDLLTDLYNKRKLLADSQAAATGTDLANKL